MSYKFKSYCNFEPIQARIETARVIVLDNLLRSVEDISSSAADEPDYDPEEWVAEERTISGFAIGNITQNIKKLIKSPELQVLHVSDLSSQLLSEYNPDAIVLSGTLRDFDLYNPKIMSNLASIITSTTIPILGICGGHQLVGQSFNVPLTTLDGLEPKMKRTNRLREYEYHFVKVTHPEDPIFTDILTSQDQVRRSKGNTIWVWQNHGLMLKYTPEGFTSLAKGYLCQNQMMVKRGDGQLIYTMQFHLEKSFEDWRKIQSDWEHINESRDGRLLFHNFLIEALKHKQTTNGASS